MMTEASSHSVRDYLVKFYGKDIDEVTAALKKPENDSDLEQGIRYGSNTSYVADQVAAREEWEEIDWPECVECGDKATVEDLTDNTFYCHEDAESFEVYDGEHRVLE